MPLFQGSGLLSLAGSLLGARQTANQLRQQTAQTAAGFAADRALIDRTLDEENRRLAKAQARVVHQRRRALNRAFGGFRAANPGRPAANPAVRGFVLSARGQG